MTIVLAVFPHHFTAARTAANGIHRASFRFGKKEHQRAFVCRAAHIRAAGKASYSWVALQGAGPF